MSKESLHNFDKVASLYDTMASWVFGQSIRQAQLDTISYIPEGASILIMGGGTRWYLKELLIRKKLQQVVYIEASRKMLSLTRQTIADISTDSFTNVELRLGTEEDILPHEQFTVIVTHFFLDVFALDYLQQVITPLNQALSPTGLWILSDFRLPRQEMGIHYLWKKTIIKCMHIFFRLTCRISARELPDFNALFAQLGMKAVYEKSYYQALIFSSVYVRNKQMTDLRR